MSAITKERIELFIKSPLENGLTRGEQMELARIALASLEAEPVAYMTYKGYLLHAADPKLAEYSEPTPLYDAPPAPISVPDAYIRDGRGRMLLNGRQEPRIGYSAGWNACRAAMLQGADGNSPVILDGWVACSERMPEEGQKVLVFRPCAEESNDPPVKSAIYKGGREYYHGFDCYCEPSHWMPLPSAPQQEVKNG
ncbi:DUF551 domain-containing protein [Escherichia coli]|nr:DUF551 domain-containing protein [Escherichia coli]